MGNMASQFTSITIVYSTVNSGTDERKQQSPASLAFVQGIHRWPVNSLHKWPVTRKMFPFDDVIMCACICHMVPLKRGQFSPQSPQYTSQRLPVKARYGVYSVSQNSDWYSASVTTLLYKIPCYIEPRYNGTVVRNTGVIFFQVLDIKQWYLVSIMIMIMIILVLKQYLTRNPGQYLPCQMCPEVNSDRYWVQFITQPPCLLSVIHVYSDVIGLNTVP